MKMFQICGSSFRTACRKIHLIDKCLIIIMFLLLIQSAYSLFTGTPRSSDANSIDTIVRTATASIFGYFLSSNFIRQESGSFGEKTKEKDSIGSAEVTRHEAKETTVIVPVEPYRDSHLQIIITTAIAVFCLIVLTIIRNSTIAGGELLTASAQATISQFRDLISGCIGFLIGVPTTRDKSLGRQS